MKKIILITFITILCVFTGTRSTSMPQKESSFRSDQESDFVKLFYIHQQKLNNLKKSNRPMLICFSGTPGMGKTTISEKLESHYSALVISSDQNRSLIKKHSSEKKKYSKEDDSDYFYFLINNLPKTNGMIVLDMSIDRTYKELLPWASKNKLPVFIIQLELSKDEAINRIKSRNRPSDPNSLKNIDSTFEDYKRFHENVGIDFYLDNSGVPNLNQLYSAIDRKIQKESSGSDSINQFKRVLLKEKKS